MKFKSRNNKLKSKQEIYDALKLELKEILFKRRKRNELREKQMTFMLLLLKLKYYYYHLQEPIINDIKYDKFESTYRNKYGNKAANALPLEVHEFPYPLERFNKILKKTYS